MSAEPKPKSIYAALRDAAEATQQPPETVPRPVAPAGPISAAQDTSEAAYWRQHIQRIDMMSDAMWAGFIDAPVNGLPTELADYVATQLSAWRLKLKLMGFSGLPPRGSAVRLAAKAKQP